MSGNAKASVRQEEIVCDQCGSPAYTAIARGTDREYYTSEDEYQTVRCDSCGLMYLNPRPVAEELGRIYPEVYHSYILDEASGSKGSFITRMRQKAAINRFRPVLKHVRGGGSVDLLDVGCGNGWGLELFRAAAPGRIKTFGVEIAQEACDIAESHGHKTYCGRFEDVELDQQFDLVNLTHVIEHVSSPRSVVRKAYEALRPGGILVLETPNAAAADARWFEKSAWGSYHYPRHWYFFTPESLEAMGESEGFKMVDHYYHPSPTTWVWTAHNMSLKTGGALGRLGEKIFDPIQIFRGGLVPTCTMGFFYLLDRALILTTGQSNVMTAIFKKPAANAGEERQAA